MPLYNSTGVTGHVKVIDTLTGNVISQIDFKGNEYPVIDVDLVITPDGTTALMPTYDNMGASGHLKIINIISGTVTHEIDFAVNEHLIPGVDVVITPDSATALMPTYDSYGASGHLKIIDIATGIVTHQIDFATNEHPIDDVDVVVTPDGTTALMPTYDSFGASGHLKIIDIATGVVSHQIDFDTNEHPIPGVDVVITPDGATALMPIYDSYGATGHLKIIDIATGIVTHQIDFAANEHPELDVDVVVTPDGATALMPTYDSYGASGHLKIIDIATGIVTRQIDFAVNEHPITGVDVVITPDGATALMPTYDSSGASGHLKIIDIATGIITHQIDFVVNEHPELDVDVIVTPDGATALMPTYDSSGASGHLKIIDIATGVVTHQIDFAVNEHPIPGVDVVITSDGATALMPTYDSSGASGHLKIIDIATGVVIHQIDFAGNEHPLIGVDVVIMPNDVTALMPTYDSSGASGHLKIIDIATGGVTYQIDFMGNVHPVESVDVVVASSSWSSLALDEDFPITPTITTTHPITHTPPITPGDKPVTTEPPGSHATLDTYGPGSIRDDELADYVCEQIPKDANGVPQVKDVKILINSCYGGGLLDDFQRVFGPGGACEGVPWVGGAASQWNEPAWGWENIIVDSPKHAAKNLGSEWTNALAGSDTSPTNPDPGSMRDRTTDNVQADLETARNNDSAGPNNRNKENPVVASGNGGSNIEWAADNTKHSAVIFGGNNNKSRHNNNLENVGQALEELWGDDLKYIGYGWGNKNTGTREHLEGLIDDACANLDADTQLVLYFNDHGDTDFDIGEFAGSLYRIIAEIISIAFPLHGGWVQGLEAMHEQPGDIPSPTLNISFIEPIIGAEWNIELNGVPIPLPAEQITGTLRLPVDWTSIQSGTNQLEISPVGTPGSPIILESLELSSGPINEIEPTLSEWMTYLPLVMRD